MDGLGAFLLLVREVPSLTADQARPESHTMILVDEAVAGRRSHHVITNGAAEIKWARR